MGKTMNPFNCRDMTTRLASGGLEAGVWTERAAIRFHLAICWFCRLYARQLRVIGESFRITVADHLSRHPVSDFKRRLKDSLGRS